MYEIVDLVFVDFVDETILNKETSSIIWRKCKRIDQHNSIWRNSRWHVIDMTHFTKYQWDFATTKKEYVFFYIINWQFEGFLCTFFHYFQRIEWNISKGNMEFSGTDLYTVRMFLFLQHKTLKKYMNIWYICVKNFHRSRLIQVTPYRFWDRDVVRFHSYQLQKHLIMYMNKFGSSDKCQANVLHQGKLWVMYQKEAVSEEVDKIFEYWPKVISRAVLQIDYTFSAINYNYLGPFTEHDAAFMI